METLVTDIVGEGKRKEHEKLNVLFSQKEVEDAIRFSKNSKAPGPDNITNEMLKAGVKYIAPILTLLFNEMLEKEKLIPETWRLGDINLSSEAREKNRGVNHERKSRTPTSEIQNEIQKSFENPGNPINPSST